MTSVKDFRIEEEPGEVELGLGVFEFTDDYSVFDWGKMPDAIPGKGASLCTMGAYNFELLENRGVPTHYEGVVVDGRPTELDELDPDELDAPPREMAFGVANVPDLPFEDGEYDYEAYHDEAGPNHFVPLEIVFRNAVPVGSSLRKRTDPSDHGLDYDEWPDEDLELDDPIVEFSTKLERQDRYLSREEADDIAGFTPIRKLESLAKAVNRFLTEHADERGFVHQDGKMECIFHQGEVKVADVVGTFDENRYLYDGQQGSKEVLRQYHQRTQPEWVQAVSDAKREARERDVADWKSLCERDPEPLDESVVGLAADLYGAGANAYTGQQWFDAPELDEVVDAVRQL
ncbi:phosphoribosylaminoimidazolesuccinocarboxamide synthase [Halobacteriales archaeon QS_1_68_20]|nr:MAG: phosphoribosylaminoimidazolesuccinocarboxamide synthase [Halobacteriales archaeon QS_1_68_20]